MRRNLLLTLVITSLFMSCSKDGAIKITGPEPAVIGGVTTYIIPKGSHYSLNNNLKKVGGSRLVFTARFDSSCAYRVSKAENILDLHKLYGFSDCAGQHHQNSARFAWRWNGSAIEIHAYWYMNGERNSTYMGSVTLMQEAEYSIFTTSSEYIFKFRDTSITVSRGCNNPNIDGYQLYPYFGGDEVAPHEMKIFIWENKAG